LDSHLPVEGSIPLLRDALASEGRAVLVAPPGSGKTTIVPLRVYDEPWARGKKTVVLEPRRVATRAAAARMADLMGVDLGGRVGYVTRTDRRTSHDTLIEVVTEGVLTRRIQTDPSLSDTGLVIFDEFHERNLQTDLGLALTLDSASVLRPDLRILVMSATIDPDPVAGLLSPGGCPVIRSEAREHPVEIRWSPATRNTRPDAHTAGAVMRLLDDEPGDVLVFLPGMREIRRVERLLDGAAAEVHILHGSLPPSEQDAALRPSMRRKVVLATDIAETSLTVEGVRLVVDSGLARMPRFDVSHGMTRLRTVPISKASADQRAGRAGRTEPGVAVRLWSRMEHAARRPHIDPEITEVDLSGFLLELAAWGVTDPSRLSFLDPPPRRSVDEARSLLSRLGAVDDSGRLTPLGEAMTHLPLHPRLARMVADAGHDAGLACLVAALVDERDPLRGHPDDIPVDLALRAAIVLGTASHPNADDRTASRVLRTADDIARRAGVVIDSVDPERTGRVLALAYPDRLAIRRGSPGRFQLRTGTTAWIHPSDPLAPEQFLVAADLDGRRKDARIRLAAAIDADDVADRFAEEVESSEGLEWDGDRLVVRSERRLGGLVLDTKVRPPEPGRETTAAILERLRRDGVGRLPWTPAARRLVERVRFLRERRPDDWPDWSDEGLLAGLDVWLVPRLGVEAGLGAVESVDLTTALKTMLDHHQLSALDRDAPDRLEVPGGRSVPVEYSTDVPSIEVRVQEMFGSATTPTVGGRPVRLVLLSPADRPVQVTDDLAGFWKGSWHDVRKDMAGRYPKHDWPEDPMRARPGRK
jgi:ATP-dependent helicase HrpB